MKRDILLSSVLLLIQLAVPFAVADCPTSPTYNTTLNAVCGANDLFVKYPDYVNLNKYYECVGTTTPVLTACPTSLIFTYVLQKCTGCDEYIPAPPCENLKSQSSSNCVSPTTATTASTTLVTSDTSAATSRTTATTAASSLPTPYYPGDSTVAPTSSSTDSSSTSGGVTRSTATTEETTAGGGITKSTATTASTITTTTASGIPTPKTEPTEGNFPTAPTAGPTPPVVSVPESS